ncbi:MAG: SDR family oxidoreductase [Jatrophihabitans sp.]|uniref:SDR family oxidoreductase n=1 Tax=Jatrophihabitans sp. TaxID=1932789 RepID=UPI00390FF881
MILVVGGTGRLGRELVPALTRQGEAVRVLTRDASKAAGPAAVGTGVELMAGDLRDPASLERAVAGCTAVVSAAHGFVGGRGAGPEQVDRDGNASLARAAKAAGIGHLVLISVHRASAHHPMSLHRMKYAAEQAVRSTGVEHTVLRPSAYYENWIEIIGGKLGSGGPAMVFGRGRNPISFVSVVDVAQAVMAGLDDPQLRGQTLDVGGPENLTMTRFAERLIEHAGGGGKIKHLPLPVMRTMSVLARPVAPAFARMAQGGVAMDTVDMTMPAGSAERFASITFRSLSDVLG